MCRAQSSDLFDPGPGRQGRPLRGLGQRHGQAALDQHRRRDAVRQRAQLDHGSLDVGAHLLNQGFGPARVLFEQPRGHAELHAQGDQPLLRTVVQVALDAVAFGLDGSGRAAPAALISASIRWLSSAICMLLATDSSSVGSSSSAVS